MMDLHTHTVASDGEATLEEAVLLAAKAGMSAVAITDHMDPHQADYAGSPGHMIQEDELEKAIQVRDGREWPIRVFIGFERGPIPVELRRTHPDLVIASVHYITKQVQTQAGQVFCEPYWHAYMDDVLRTVSGPQISILGHMAGYLPMKHMLAPGSTFEERREIERDIAQRFFTSQWYEKVFRTALERGIAVEIHCPSHSPSPDMVRMGLAMGVRFTVGSDGHAKSWIGDVSWGYDLLNSLGADPESVWSPGLHGQG